jgi:hypothetical protein
VAHLPPDASVAVLRWIPHGLHRDLPGPVRPRHPVTRPTPPSRI